MSAVALLLVILTMSITWAFVVFKVVHRMRTQRNLLLARIEHSPSHVAFLVAARELQASAEAVQTTLLEAMNMDAAEAGLLEDELAPSTAGPSPAAADRATQVVAEPESDVVVQWPGLKRRPDAGRGDRPAAGLSTRVLELVAELAEELPLQDSSRRERARRALHMSALLALYEPQRLLDSDGLARPAKVKRRPATIDDIVVAGNAVQVWMLKESSRARKVAPNADHITPALNEWVAADIERGWVDTPPAWLTAAGQDDPGLARW